MTCLFAAQSVFVVCVLARLVVPVMMFLPLLNSPFFSFGLFRIWSTHWHPSGRGVSEERGQSRITKLNLACLLLLGGFYLISL